MIIEKGKGPVLGKLHIIQLIEADLQLLIRVYLNRNQEDIEIDQRISKSNYGLWKNYSIDSAILEKRLIFDASILNSEKTVYNITDIQSYYDYQLVNFGSIIQKSVGMN